MHAALVEQAKRGDREAFDALARLTGDRCMAIAFRILRDFALADDAVQSALLTAWCEIRSLRDPERFEPWLHRILTNACYTEARRRTRWSQAIRLLPVEPTYGSDDYLTVELRDQLDRAFRRLTDRTANRPGVPPLPRAAAARDRGPHRHPARDCEVTDASRQAGTPGQPRSRSPDSTDISGANGMTARTTSTDSSTPSFGTVRPSCPHRRSTRSAIASNRLDSGSSSARGGCPTMHKFVHHRPSSPPRVVAGGRRSERRLLGLAGLTGPGRHAVVAFAVADPHGRARA